MTKDDVYEFIFDHELVEANEEGELQVNEFGKKVLVELLFNYFQDYYMKI